MIPHKNLFTGSLGNLQNIGGSRIYTTPHTVTIPAEHSINVTYNVQGDLVGHSLDGRLWLYRRSRRLGIIALKWNITEGKLEYAAGQNISNNDDVVLACGLDWVLTNNNIFMVSDGGEILSVRLFDANIPDTFLYSLLRSGSIGESGIDPFTGEAWGKREDNGNSEGTGYFSKSTHLLYPAGSHVFEQCYSLLPPVGDWQIFENFLVRRPVIEDTPDTENITSYNYMHAVRPLIPLEFANGSAAYGTGYNFDHRGIQLFHRNGEIFGKGYQSIGKVSLLPAVFGENGEVQEYYLYISPDFTYPQYPDFFYCKISTFDVSNGDEKVNIHSFAVSSKARTWAEAKSICEALGGHLATSTSAEKNTFLTSLSTAIVWLGATDENTESSWRWVTGEAWNYTNWGNGQPDNTRNNEHYLEMNRSNLGSWNDNSPTAILPYICEWDYEVDVNNFLPSVWANISLASIGSDSLYGFLSEQADALSGNTCFKSIDGRILLLASGDFLTLSENNAQIFFDVLSYKDLLLDNNGGQLMLGDRLNDVQNVKCKTLRQWLTPAGLVDAVTDDYIIASADNSAFCTSLVTGFNRQFLSPNTIPITAKAFQDTNDDFYRLSISEGINENNRKVFRCNKILSQNITPNPIEWQDIYKEPVEFTFVKALDQPKADNDCLPFEGYGIPNIFIYGQEISLHMAHVRVKYRSDGEDRYSETYIDIGQGFTSTEGIAYYVGCEVIPYEDPYPELSEVSGYVILSASANVIFLNPLDGSLHTVSLVKSFQQSFSTTTQPYGNGTISYRNISIAEVPYGIGYTNNQIGFYGFIYDIDKNHLYGPRDYGYHSYEQTAPLVFFPCTYLPDFVTLLRPNEGEDTIQPSIISTIHNSVIGWDDKEKSCNIIFQENSSGVKFIQQSSVHQDSALSCCSPDDTGTCPNYDTKFIDSAGVSRSKQNFHIIHLADSSDENQDKLLLFHSEVFPEIFDFPAEVERSKSL